LEKTVKEFEPVSESKHRFLIVGVGSIGERHTRCFLATDRVEVGICELNDSLRSDVAERYGIEKSYATLAEALVESWDAALVATPAHTHIPIALQLAQQGIPLLIEKPLATNLDGADDLVREVKERNLLAAVSYNYRAHPALASMKAALDSGRFGAIHQLYACLGQNFATYRPAYADIYFADRKQGGGAIQDSLTHIINMGEWLAGPVDRIAGDAMHQQLPGVDVEDTVHAFARHGNVMASYALNMYQLPNESIITLVCEKATLRFEVQHSRWRWMYAVEGEWHDEYHLLENRDSWYISNANAFLDALEGTADPLCSLEEGLHTLKVNQALLASLDADKWEDIS
jgi:predicted dehydrogenase